MTDSSPQVDESKEDAARTLFEPSQVMLYALAHGISPHTVRTRLIDHVAGVPPKPQREVDKNADPFRNMSASQAGGSSSSSTSTFGAGMGTASRTGRGTGGVTGAISSFSSPTLLFTDTETASTVPAPIINRLLELTVELGNGPPVVARVRRPRRRKRGQRQPGCSS